MSGFKRGDKVVCVNLEPMVADGTSWATKAGCKVGGIYTVLLTDSNSLKLEDYNFHLPSKNFKLSDKKEEEEVSYNINGDIVLATKTSDVFLYLGGKYYNLSSGSKEMRGRSFIKSSDGPLHTISNLSNSGDMFKDAVRETITDTPYVEEVPF